MVIKNITALSKSRTGFMPIHSQTKVGGLAYLGSSHARCTFQEIDHIFGITINMILNLPI